MHVIKRTLEGHEDIIRDGLKSFVDVGQSLAAIRDQGLYPQKYSTFEHYLKERWGFSKSWAYQQIKSCQAALNLSTIVDTKVRPVNEAQARAVASASDDPEVQRRVWEASVKAADDGKPTAAVVKRVAAQVIQSENRKSGVAPATSAPAKAPEQSEPAREFPAEDGPVDDGSTLLDLPEAQAELRAALDEIRKQWPPDQLEIMADMCISFGKKLEKEVSGE